MSEESFHPQTRAEWRSWLKANHARSSGIWVVNWRKGSGHEPWSYEDIVGQALCFGSVDSKTRRLDEARTILWVAPRKKGSGWSRPNQEGVARLEASKQMAASGRRVIEAAKAFADHPPAAAEWESFPRSAKRGILEWIVQARRPYTRAKRTAETARLAATGERANQWQPRKEK
ncbi:MAG: YdeI/OmpD-associated family protein [Actinomycetia bacterium]|nr:YdeI/OmpD-associated family protein [Actinomycetes bacterium]